MIKYTIGYIDHNQEVFEEKLGLSLKTLEGEFKIIYTSDEYWPAKNYNKILSECDTKYLILTHQDVTFSKNLLENLDITIDKLQGEFGALCLVGVNDNVYIWSNLNEIYSVENPDCGFLVINMENDIKFDEVVFNDFHLYVEDYCAQLKLQNKNTYTILTSSNNDVNENSYIIHYGVTTSQRGFAWGEWVKYHHIFNQKWYGIKIDKNMKIYEPIIRETPKIYDKYPSAWGDIPTIIKDIIVRFNLKTNLCLEFGVENGYSTSVFSNYFKQVIGVDTFEGDIHTIDKEEHYDRTKEELSIFENIKLVKNDFVDFIKDDNNNVFYDLIHIDIVHTYNETYSCGEWSVNRSPITIFHDTESFEDVKKVCIDLSEKYNLEFFNYPDSHGLGILFNKKLYEENV